MEKVKLEIFLNLKNFYQLSLEIKDEKDPDLKSLKKTIATGIYDHLNRLLIAYRDLFKNINRLFKNVKSVEDVRSVKLESK